MPCVKDFKRRFISLTKHIAQIHVCRLKAMHIALKTKHDFGVSRCKTDYKKNP